MLSRIASEVRHRVRALARRKGAEADLDAELRFHVEQEARKLEARGLSPAEAHRQALVAFGGMERIKEDARDARGVSTVEQLWSDLRYTMRSLRAHRTFTLGVVTTLALGIGANAAMFGILDRLMFRTPQGLRTPDRVHRLFRQWTQDGELRTERNMQFPRYRDFARETRSFDVVAAFQVRTAALGQGEDTHEGAVAVVTASFLSLFDAPPALGRWFTPAEDEVPAGAPVVVLSYAYWQSRFGGRTDVIGQRFNVDRMDATIVGVAPEGFEGIADQAPPLVFAPMSAYAHALRGPRYVNGYSWGWLEVIVRRREGVSIAAANADLSNAARISARAEAAASNTDAGLETLKPSAFVAPVHLGRGPAAQLDARVTWWTSGVALIVLLIACANVTNLHLARGMSRRRELAMRLALGVGRARLARQLFLESLVLGTMAGVLGLVLARYAGTGLRTLLLPDASATSVISDGRTLLFAFGLSLMAGVVTALIPAVLATRLDVAASLKAGGRTASHRRSRLQAGLVVAQAALSVVLLVGATLFVRSLRHAQDHRIGFDVDRVLYAEVNLRGTRLSDTALRALAFRMMETSRATPGVSKVAMAVSVPFWSNEGRGLIVPGVDSVERLGNFILQSATNEYFETVGTRILAGRGFTNEDTETSMPIVVVSEGMARALWPGKDPIGRCIHIDDAKAQCRTVVGVAEETSLRRFSSNREFSYYLPVVQFPEAASLQFFIRVADGALPPEGSLRSRLQALMPGVAYVNVNALSRFVAPQYRGWKFGATFFAAFGGLALVLAALGLYAVVAYEVSQREKELGVRLALGASPGRLMRSIVGQGTGMALAGVAIGTLVAFAAAPQLESLLFRQGPRDPVVLLGVCLVLLAAACLASLVPGWRATRVEPVATLRGD